MTLHTPAPALSLASLVFTDVYIGSDNPREALFRGLEAARVDDQTRLEVGPEQVRDELEQLIRVIIEADDSRGGEGRGSSDFLVCHQGGRYRVARISRSVRNPDERFYCLRKIREEDFVDLWKNTRPDVRKIAEMSLGRRGLIIFSGSFSTGKTRNAAMLTDYWARKGREMVVTLEDPPEYALDRRTGDEGVVVQSDISTGGLSQQLFNMRRWAPRYVFFGELRSAQMAGALLHMAISGPLTLCTLHAASPTQAVYSLVRYAAEVMDEATALDIVSSSLLGIVHHDRVGNRFTTQCHDFSGPDVALLRSKIRTGRPSALEEELDRRVRAARSGIS